MILITLILEANGLIKKIRSKLLYIGFMFKVTLGGRWLGKLGRHTTKLGGGTLKNINLGWHQWSKLKILKNLVGGTCPHVLHTFRPKSVRGSKSRAISQMHLIDCELSLPKECHHTHTHTHTSHWKPMQNRFSFKTGCSVKRSLESSGASLLLRTRALRWSQVTGEYLREWQSLISHHLQF